MDGYDVGEVLTICNDQANEKWIMDFACTYHMTPRKDFLFDFKSDNGGKVLIGNEQTCSVTGIGSVNFNYGMAH